MTWWGPVGTGTVAQRRAPAFVCVYVCACVACIIGLAVTWCGTVGVLVWTGLGRAELGRAGAGQRGALCAHICVCVCVCGCAGCGGMYNRIRCYLVRCSWRWAFASCSARLRASACHWLPSFWTASRCCRQPTSSELSLSTSCPAEMGREGKEEVAERGWGDLAQQRGSCPQANSMLKGSGKGFLLKHCCLMQYVSKKYFFR